MTAGELLSSKSSVSNVTAKDHLKNIIAANITAQENYITETDIVTLEPKNDIISLKYEKDTILETIKETETKMEILYGIQKDC